MYPSLRHLSPLRTASLVEKLNFASEAVAQAQVIAACFRMSWGPVPESLCIKSFFDMLYHSTATDPPSPQSVKKQNLCHETVSSVHRDIPPDCNDFASIRNAVHDLSWNFSHSTPLNSRTDSVADSQCKLSTIDDSLASPIQRHASTRQSRPNEIWDSQEYLCQLGFATDIDPLPAPSLKQAKLNRNHRTRVRLRRSKRRKLAEMSQPSIEAGRKMDSRKPSLVVSVDRSAMQNAIIAKACPPQGRSRLCSETGPQFDVVSILRDENS